MDDSGKSRHPYSMNEEEWLSSSDPMLMLTFLPYAGLDRKFRLFACGCARRVWHLCNHELPRQLLELGERFADGLGSRDELLVLIKEAYKLVEEQHKSGPAANCNAAAAMAAAGVVSQDSLREFEAQACAKTAGTAAVWALACAAKAGIQTQEGNERYKQAEAAERAAQAELLRDVFGNVFRPEPAMDATWLIPSPLSLAQEVYGKKCFEQLPALASLLEDGGCKNVGLLRHLRQAGSHVRGCWALDCVLGRDGVPDVVAMLLGSDDPGEQSRGISTLGTWHGRRIEDLNALERVMRVGRHEWLRKEAKEALKQIAPERLNEGKIK